MPNGTYGGVRGRRNLALLDHLKMPNGCRGAMFFNKALLRTRVKEGDMVTAIVIGFIENDDAVKCSLR